MVRLVDTESTPAHYTGLTPWSDPLPEPPSDRAVSNATTTTPPWWMTTPDTGDTRPTVVYGARGQRRPAPAGKALSPLLSVWRRKANQASAFTPGQANGFEPIESYRPPLIPIRIWESNFRPVAPFGRDYTGDDQVIWSAWVHSQRSFSHADRDVVIGQIRVGVAGPLDDEATDQVDSIEVELRADGSDVLLGSYHFAHGQLELNGRRVPGFMLELDGNGLEVAAGQCCAPLADSGPEKLLGRINAILTVTKKNGEVVKAEDTFDVFRRRPRPMGTV
jgi:hypothetical protein